MSIAQLTDIFIEEGHDVPTAIALAVSGARPATPAPVYREEIVSSTVTRIVRAG